MSLAEKIRKSRRVEVNINGMTFYGRRPTEQEFGSLSINNMMSYDVCKMFIDGWKNVREVDIVSDGGGDIVEYDKDVFDEWIVDDHVIANEISGKLLNAAVEKINSARELEKNLDAGSKASKSQK